MQKRMWKSGIALLLSVALFLTGVLPAGMQVQAQDIISVQEDIVSSEMEILEESGEKEKLILSEQEEEQENTFSEPKIDIKEISGEESGENRYNAEVVSEKDIQVIEEKEKSAEMETVSEETLPGGTMNDGKITWSIDGNGKLTVTGEGDLERSMLVPYYPWGDYKEQIYTAEVSVIGCTDLQYLFNGCKNMTSVDLRNLDTSNVTNMNGMFGGCASLETIDLSSLNTGNVTDMGSMFAGCTNLQSVSLGEWDVSKVTYMGSMFAGCNSLQTVDFNNWNTQSLTSVNGMFKRCEALKTVKLKNWNTINLSDAFGMFQECAALEEVDLSGWNTENVTKTGSMFLLCSKLTEVNMEGWNIENITNLGSMFRGCSKLQEIPLVLSVGTNIETGTSNKIDMFNMFADCNSLTKVDLSNSNIRNTDMRLMFARCQGLEEVNLQNSNLDYSNLTYMFSGCENLISVNFNGVNATDVDFGAIFDDFNNNSNCKNLVNVSFSNSNLDYSDLTYMFSGCSNLKTVDFSQCNIQGVTSLSGMFSGCTSIERIDLSDLNISGITSINGMFSRCTNLKEIIFDTKNKLKIKDISGMFSGCSGLTSLDLSFISTSDVQNMSSVFSGCSSLTSLNLDGWDTSNVTNMSNMFNNCEVWRSWDSWKLDTGNVTDMSKMFADSNTLTEISAEDLKELDMSQVEDITGMFEHCDNLTKVDFRNLDTPNLKRAKDMFKNCPKLEYLDLSGMDMSKFVVSSAGANSHREMLQNCNELKIIYTPKNVPKGAYIKLPAQKGEAWYLSNKDTTTIIPEDMVYQPVLQKNEVPNVEGDIWTPEDLVIEGIEINQKGNGYVKFRAISVKGQLLKNKEIYYYFEDVTGDIETQEITKDAEQQGLEEEMAFGPSSIEDRNSISLQEIKKVYQSALSDAEGMVTIKTPELTNTTGEAEEIELKLHLFREVSETEKENLGYTVLAKITVYPLSFTQNWELGIEGSVTGGVGPEAGISVGVAKVEASLAQAEIEGSLGGKMSVEHSVDKGERTLTLFQNYNARIAAQASAGLSGKLDVLGKENNVDIMNAETGISSGANVGVGLEINNYDPGNKEQIWDIGKFMLASQAQVTGNAMLVGLAELAGIDIYNLTQVGTNIAMESGAKLVSADILEGLAEGSLLAAGYERTLSYEATFNEGEQEVKEDDSTEFAFSINNQKEFAIGSVEYPTKIGDLEEGVFSLPADNTSQIGAKLDSNRQLQEVTVRREIADSDGFILEEGTVDAVEITYAQENATKLAQEFPLLNSFVTQEKHYIFGDKQIELFDYLETTKYEGEYSVTHTDLNKQTAEFDIGAKLGIGLEVGVGVEGVQSCEYETLGGTYASGQRFVSNSNEIADEVKNNQKTFIELIWEPLDIFWEELTHFVTDACENIKNGVETAFAKVQQKGEEIAEGTSEWFLHIVSLEMDNNEELTTQSYEIMVYSTVEEEVSTQEESQLEEKKAYTIGSPYMVYATQGKEGEVIADYTNNPLELTLRYTEEMLEASGIGEEDRDKIAIYQYSQELLGYVYLGGEHNTEAKEVTLTITEPGQYLLAVDTKAPQINDVKVATNDKNTQIEVYFDEEGGFGEFSLKIDDIEYVTTENWKNYYDTDLRKIMYCTDMPLSVGEHTLTITASDTAGNAMAEPMIYPFVVELKEEEVKEGLRYVFLDGSGPDNSQYIYTGKAIKPQIEIYDGETLLTEKKDYTLSYSKNVNAGKGIITVKGKGNYGSKTEVNFTILPKDISNKEDNSITIAEFMTLKNGKVQKKVPVIKYNNKKLSNKKDKDFVVTYPDTETGAYQNVGSYIVHIEGQGNYTGGRDIDFQIGSKKVSKLSVPKIDNQEYTGSAVEPDIIVKNGKTKLERDVHYRLQYENNTRPGTARVIITGIPEYVGTKIVNFKITGVPMNKVKITGVPKTVSYDGEEKEPKLTLTYEDIELVEDTHYTVDYSNHTKAGKATVTITGLGKYTGTVKKTFKINPFDVKYDTEGLLKVEEGMTAVYAKGGVKPKPEVTFKGELLTPGTDYTLSYSNNKAVTTEKTKKMPTVVVKLKGNYKGILKESFTITPQSLENLKVWGNDVVVSDKKYFWKSTVTIEDLDGKVLKAGTDYEKKLSYYLDENCTIVADADTYAEGTKIFVKILGKGNYAGSETVTCYHVVEKSIAKAKVKIQDQVYKGTPTTITTDMIEEVEVNGEKLTADVDYEIVPDSCKNNEKKGTATVQLQGKDEYGGRITVKFKIKQKDFKWEQILEALGILQ